MVRRFLASRSGNFAIVSAVAALPLLLAIGVAIDYTRYLSAHQHLQEVSDAAALALASSPDRDEAKLRKSAEDYVASNVSAQRIDQLSIADLDIDGDQIDLRLAGRLPTIFMGIANYHWLNIAASSLAERAVTGSVEVALVLDNTWSMSATDAKGVSRIASLKTAANALLVELTGTPNADVKIALVPYADYVNVGTGNRNASWLSVGPDVAAVPATCVAKEVDDSGKCLKTVKKTCSRTVDGIPETYACNTCEQYEFQPPRKVVKQVCSGGVSAQKWYGCVGSRMSGTTRLDDKSPGVPYPGYVESSQRCLNPIITLTSDQSRLKAGIDGMIINIGTGYRPFTYIPAGLIWGVNVLSPSAPFTDGLAYDASNKTPRKAIVLMTDGENTMKFRASDGRHVSFNIDDENATKKAAALKDFAKVNAETLDICTYAKSNKIEIFTVAFMVENADSKAMMQACATDAEHYFDASDPDKLLAAFSGIARSLSLVRLAR